MKTISGDLIQLAKAGKFDVIAHGCNCFCTMGAGIAKQIKYHFPEAYRADLFTLKGDKSKLGTCSFAEINIEGRKLFVVNAYTQYFYGRGSDQIDYDAVKSCMKWINSNFPGKSIGLPCIGAGLAGGDWERIKMIIENELSNVNLAIVEYNNGMENSSTKRSIGMDF